MISYAFIIVYQFFLFFFIFHDFSDFSSFIHLKNPTGINNHPVRSAYQPPASSTFLSERTSNQPRPASSTLLSEQTSPSHQPPANRTGQYWIKMCIVGLKN
jgi:hypothetical protein